MEEKNSKVFDKKLGEILSNQRHMHGLSQQAVADKMKVTKTAISYWENGDRSMYAYTVIKYCNAIEIDVSEIINIMKTRMTIDERIGYALHTERKNSGLTLREAAKKMDVDNSTISKWETGKNRISVVDLLKYLKVLGIKTDYFFRKIENEE